MRDATHQHQIDHEVIPPGLTTNAYRNADGKRVIYGLVFELDNDLAHPSWLDPSGRLSWSKISTFLSNKHETVYRFISHVFTSENDCGLILVVAINPLPIQDSTAKNQRSAQILSYRLSHFFSELGFGVAPRPRGLLRLLPDFKDSARCLAYNRRLLRLLEEEREPVLGVLHNYLNNWRDAYRKRRIYADKRAESGLAKLLLQLTKNASSMETYSTKNLVAITGLSGRFLRQFLHSHPTWLHVNYERETRGWRLATAATGSDLESLLERAAELT